MRAISSKASATMSSRRKTATKRSRCLAGNGEIDLLFTDVVMAGGLSGFDLGRIVRERWPSVRILYTSGYTQEDGDNIVGDLLPKPYSLESLSQKVKETMGAD